MAPLNVMKSLACLTAATLTATALSVATAGSASAEVTRCIQKKTGTRECTVTFPAGEETEWSVPSGVVSVAIDLSGAQGGDIPQTDSHPAATGGKGGEIRAVRAVTPGLTFHVIVGSHGEWASPDVSSGGFNGGGNGASSSGQPAAGGGGATKLSFGGPGPEETVVAVAGGGGGASWHACNGEASPHCPSNGGAGGGLAGSRGETNTENNNYPAAGGTQDNGGRGTRTDGCEGFPGNLWKGGDAYACGERPGGGGGGGFNGGGGGSNGASGGGGSSYLNPRIKGIIRAGVKGGNGTASIRYTQQSPVNAPAATEQDEFFATETRTSLAALSRK